MKKLLAVSAFIVLGCAAFAQAPSKKAAAAPASVAPASMQVTPVVNETAVPEQVSVAETKKDAKKECSTEEKKACGSKAGKKSCCSSKAEAKKEDGK